MDWNRLLQGMGGRLLRQGLGLLMREGVKRIGGPQKPKAQTWWLVERVVIFRKGI